MSKKCQLMLAGVLCLFESAGSFAQQRISSPGHYAGYSRTLYSEWVRTSQYVTVRDGTRLAADIYRPAVNGKAVAQVYPVVWQHTFARTRSRTDTVVPGSVFAMVKELTKYGYVVVEVDRRGMGASFGARRGYLDRTEARDAFDVTEWLAAQSWSDGNVGVYGCSNTGAAAMQVPTLMPPHLKACSPAVMHGIPTMDSCAAAFSPTGARDRSARSKKTCARTCPSTAATAPHCCNRR